MKTLYNHYQINLLIMILSQIALIQINISKLQELLKIISLISQKD